jgi:transcription antitermination factor NusG
MKKGDKVKVISGEYSGAIGHVKAITNILDSKDKVVTVQPDENADPKNFYMSELEVIS